LVRRLYERAKAGRWALPERAFAEALGVSAAKAGDPASRDVERYLGTLHLEDLALACACAEGIDAAWEHFVLQYRPILYRAADALEPGGGAREIADSIYADLYGLDERDGVRRSLFRYFHGRSSLATWLRAVLAQRQVDRVRSHRRLEPLEGDESIPSRAVPVSADPDRARYLEVVGEALAAAIAELADRDRLRLGCYYGQQLTLAEIGRLLGEHEATASRHLARTRKVLREAVERRLRAVHGFSEAEVARCVESAMDDPGPLDLEAMLSRTGKEPEPERST
jgi:RNA polymerase sigma-70 factor (ECF subfamily)